jgi:pimeloyl-ACP methyl ester carboxylesterase
VVKAREVLLPMTPRVGNWFELGDRLCTYTRQVPLVLVNGLAEQPESWFANRAALSRHFDLKVPEILVYDGDALHRRIDSGEEISVEYLADRLCEFLDQFIQRSPSYLVASSLGCQVALTVALRRPESVTKLVLLCPSGFHGTENLPVIEGISRGNYEGLVGSVFHRGRFASEELVGAFRRKFQDRRWKKGVLRTIRGTLGHSVSSLLPLVSQPVLLIWGADDRVLTDLPGAIRAGEGIRRARHVVIPRCGHAPQIEHAGLVNRLISRFLRDQLKTIPPGLSPERFLNRAGMPSFADASLATHEHALR